MPSWRSWIALLVGLTVGIGAFILSAEETRVGVRSSNVTVDDRAGYFDEEKLRDAIDEVTWGRSMRILISVVPFSDLPPSDHCAQDNIGCIRPLYPSYFPTARVETGSAVLWLDPEREVAHVRMGVQHQYRGETFSQTEFDISRVLSYRAASGELSPESIADAFQLLSDEESGVQSGRSWTDYLLAMTAGGIAALLVALILNAAMQSRANRRQALGLARLSTAERRKIVDRVFNTYRDAGSDIDEIELVRASNAGSYEKTLDLRVTQYQRRYVQLARAIFEVQHLERDELTKTAHLPDLVVLDRIATIVEEAMLTLRADEKVLALRPGRGSARATITQALADHPSMSHMRKALEAATELAEATGDERLIKGLPDLAHDLEQAGAGTPQATLVDLDRLARRFATIADPVFVSYAGAHGREFERRADIEDPFRFRTLELTRSGAVAASGKNQRRGIFSRGRKGVARKRDVTSAQVKQNLEERLAAAKVESDAASLKVPVSPVVIMIAAALAIAAGGIYLLLNPVGAGNISDGEAAAVTIPESIAPTPEHRSAAVTIPEGDDYDELRLPESVEVIDEAGLFDDPQALEEAISQIPMPGPARYLVLTTDEELPPDSMGDHLDAGLLDAFPEHYEPIGESSAMVIAEDTMIVWYADSGEQVGFDLHLGSDLDRDYDGRSRTHSAVRNSYPSFELQVWDTLAGFSNGSRGIGLDASDSTLESGTSNVSGAVWTSLVTFAIFVFLLPQVIKPFVVRRRKKSWEAELSTTMTALTLAHGALSLYIDMLTLDHRDYDAAERFRRWNEDYLDALRLTVNAPDPILSLEAQLRLARTVREQAESLWRIRPILEMDPTWGQAWENESSALYAALDKTGSIQISHITALAPQLADGTISPARALRALDDIAGEQSGTARLRCVESIELPAEEPGGGLDAADFEDTDKSPATIFSSRLMTDSRRLAATPVFSLAPKDSIDIGLDGSSAVGAGETVQEITREQETAKAFFSIDTSATRWLQSVGKTAFGSLRGLHEASPSQVTKTLFIYTGIGITALITFQIVTFIIGDGRDTTVIKVERSDTPLSVTYVNDGGEELPDDLIERIEKTELGMPVNLLIYSIPGECTYTTIENASHLAEEAPLAVSNVYDRVRANSSGVVLCLGEESAYINNAINVDVGDSFDDAVFEFRFYDAEELDHEEWLTAWLDDPGRGPAFEQDFVIVKQIDSAIR